MTKKDYEGNLVFTWAGMDGSISSQELTEKCAAALRDVGASDSYCQFFSDLLKCEYEINTVVHKVHQSLDNEATDISDPAALLKGIQDLTRHYNMWHHTVNSLNKKSRDVPALSVDSDRLDKSAHLKALCSIDTNQLNVKPGDDITIVDTSVPNRLKVRTSEGQEGYVPALSCILPSPDRNPSAATQRLRLELLASWTESVRKLKTLLTECLGLCSQKLAADWKAHVPTSGTSSNRERVSRRYKRLRSVVTRLPNADLNKLHHALFSLEKELSQLEDNGSATSDTKAMISKLSALDKAVLCYQMFQKQLEMFRQALESCEHPIRVVDHWEQLKPAGKQRPVRYFEVKMTLEDVETIEEVEYRKSDETTEFSSSSGAERVETDQITSTQSEEQRS